MNRRHYFCEYKVQDIISNEEILVEFKDPEEEQDDDEADP